MHAKNYVIVHVTPRRRLFMHFACLSESIKWEKNNYTAPGFQLKPFERFRFWMKKLETCENLKKVWIEKIVLCIMLYRENDSFWIFRASSKKNDFELGILRRVRFWNKVLNFVWTFEFSLQNVRESEKKFAVKIYRYDWCYSMKMTCFACFVLLRKALFQIRNITTP